MARSFKELMGWQQAMDLAMLGFELSKRFPVEERYSLTDQIPANAPRWCSPKPPDASFDPPLPTAHLPPRSPKKGG